MLELLGFKVPQPQPPKPALKTEEKVNELALLVCNNHLFILFRPPLCMVFVFLSPLLKSLEMGEKWPSLSRVLWRRLVLVSDFIRTALISFTSHELQNNYTVIWGHFSLHSLFHFYVVNKDEDFRMPFLSHQQLPAGILPMVPEVAQAVGANQGPHAKDYGRTAAPNPAKATVTAMIANELLYAGTSPTAEGILKTNNSLAHRPHGPLTRPSEQLGYLANVQGLQVCDVIMNTHLHARTYSSLQLNLNSVSATGWIQGLPKKQQEWVCVSNKLLLSASSHQPWHWQRRGVLPWHGKRYSNIDMSKTVYLQCHHTMTVLLNNCYVFFFFLTGCSEHPEASVWAWPAVEWSHI